MSMFLSALMFVLLLAVAIAHFVWSIGGSWPIRDKAMLPAVVIGRPGVAEVPRFPALVVSILVLLAGVIAAALADHDAGGALLNILGLGLAAVFLGRGAIGYTKGWRDRFSVEPFATLDRRNYSPLCLFLGVGYLLLVIMRLI